jgi:hypothetical protein
MEGYTPLEGSSTSVRHFSLRRVLITLVPPLLALTIGTLVTTALKVVLSAGYEVHCLHFMRWRWIVTTIWFAITQGGGFWLSFWLGSPPRERPQQSIDGVAAPPPVQHTLYATPETFKERLRSDPSTAIVAGVILLLTAAGTSIMLAFVEVLVVGIIVTGDGCDSVQDVWLWLWLCVGALDMASILLGLLNGYTRERFWACCDPLCR